MAQRLVARVEQHHPDLAGIDPPEAGAERALGELADLSGDLDAGRTGADDRHRQPARPLLGILAELGHLQRLQQPPPQAERIGEGLHAGRVGGQLVVAEVREPGARGDDQAVVRNGDRRAVRALGTNHPRLQVEAGDLGQHHRRVALVPQDVPQRRGDLPFGEDACRDLVEQRLEQVVGLAIDEGDVDRRPAERARREQAAEASAHDHHPVARRRAPDRPRRRPPAIDCAGRARTAAPAPARRSRPRSGTRPAASRACAGRRPRRRSSASPAAGTGTGRRPSRRAGPPPRPPPGRACRGWRAGRAGRSSRRRRAPR